MKTNEELLKDAESLARLVAAINASDDTTKNAVALAKSMINTIELEKNRAANEMELNRLIKIREEVAAGKKIGDYLEDGSLETVCAYKMTIDDCKRQYIEFSEKSFNKALDCCRSIIEMLSKRWGFGDEFDDMLEFLFTDHVNMEKVFENPCPIFSTEEWDEMYKFLFPMMKRIDSSIERQSVLVRRLRVAFNETDVINIRIMGSAICACLIPESAQTLREKQELLDVLYKFIDRCIVNEDVIRCRKLVWRIDELTQLVKK